MKRLHHKRVLLAVLLLVFAYALYSGYNYLYPLSMEHVVSLDVTGKPAAEVLAELESAGAQKIYVFFTNQNAIPMYFLGPGEERSRELIVQAPYDFPVSIQASLSGNLSSFLTLSETNFDLAPGTNRTLWITAKVPAGASEGQYLSTLKIDVKRKLR